MQPVFHNNINRFLNFSYISSIPTWIRCPIWWPDELFVFNLVYIDSVKSRKQKERLNFLILFFGSSQFVIPTSVFISSSWYKNKKGRKDQLALWKQNSFFKKKKEVKAYFSKHKYVGIRVFLRRRSVFMKAKLWQNKCQT